jgi:S-formylglutathione hydrolase
MTLELLNQTKVANGQHSQYQHQSDVLHCAMRFAIFLPPNASTLTPVPVLYWLSGLTCTDENFMQKAGAFKKAAELGIAIVAPDTSPRGEGVADDAGYDLGQGAGFYLNATQAPWSSNYHMYDYISSELPQIIEANFPVTSVKSISGHSMGGHGALTIGLKNPDAYRSISAFSPITNPINCPWGQKALSAYLGSQTELWHAYDTCELIKHATHFLPTLIDQGDADNFLHDQLKPENLVKAAAEFDYKINFRMQAGYDHSYYFIQSFIDQHLEFHNQYLA